MNSRLTFRFSPFFPSLPLSLSLSNFPASRTPSLRLREALLGNQMPAGRIRQIERGLSVFQTREGALDCSRSVKSECC